MNTSGNSVQESAFNGSYSRSLQGLWGMLLCLVLGLGLTAFMYQYFVHIDQDRIEEHVLRGTQVLASTEASAEIDQDVQATFPALDTLARKISDSGRIDASLLESVGWQSPNPLTEATGLRYLPRVRFNAEMNGHEMMDPTGRWLPFTLPIKNFNDQGTLAIDNNKAAEYFPVLFSTGGTILTNLAGVNFLSDPSYRVAMTHSRDTGVYAYRTSYPRGGQEEPYLFHIVFKALYRTGSNPVSEAERRDNLVGYLSAVVMIKAQSFIEFIPESYQGMHVVFLRAPKPFTAANLEPTIRALIDGGELAIAQVRNNDVAEFIVTKPSNAQIRALESNDRWWAVAIGLLLTLWVSSLLFSGNRRSQAMQKIITERTSDLAERSERLEELNLALLKSERLYRMVATNVHDVIYSHDMEGICTYISPSVKQVLGYEADELLGKSLFDIMTEKSRQRVLLAVERARNNPDAYDDYKTYEHGIYARDGSLKTMECTVSTLAENEHKVSGFLVVSRDITERKKNQEENEKLKQAIQQAQKMEAIGALAGGIAHDFNNLLSGILGHAELIKADGNTSAQTAHSAGVIETAALRGKQLTTQLLGFARKGQFQQKPVDINRMIAEVVQLFERTLGKDVIISCTLSPQAPVVVGDPGQINQILLNLAINARDAMPGGGRLSFETAIVRFGENDSPLQLPAGNYCEIRVADTGIGIADDKIERIFEPFFSDKEEGKGTGLGLAMVYGVVNNHGGKVHVYSELDRGTVFRIYLPLSASCVLPDEPVANTSMSRGSGKVMVVDDDTIVRELSEELLKSLGYDTTGFGDARQAIAWYQDHADEVDLVLMDLVMPLMDGRSCLQHLHKLNPALKAVIVTGYTSDSINAADHQDYIKGLLQKPFTLKQLSEIVNATLG